MIKFFDQTAQFDSVIRWSTNIEYQNAFQINKTNQNEEENINMCLIMHDAFSVLRQIGPEIKQQREKKKMIQFWNSVRKKEKEQ